MKHLGVLITLSIFLSVLADCPAKEPILLANNPNLSPDGSHLAFDWNGDIWTVPINGGAARQLTQHSARDREPKFSPDGKEIAFVSDRDGSAQVYLMPVEGGTPRQVTHHTAGYSLQGWSPDGASLIVESNRDNYWRHAERFYRIDPAKRSAEQVIFDDYGHNGTLSPDGKRLLFTREGPAWWRKGYHGSQASQIWMYDLDKKTFARVLDQERGDLWPMWKPNGRGFYYVGGQSGSFNLWEHDLDGGRDRQLTKFTDDSVVFPCISRDGSTIVFRQLFDLYVFRPVNGDTPRKIDICQVGDRASERKERRVLQTASAVSFTQDGLEVAFIAGGDLWVMDTELREPKQITNSAEEEREPLFSPDGETILFTSDMNGQSEIWKAERADKTKYWWQNSEFKLEKVTNDGDVKSDLSWNPDGKKIGYVRGRGDLWVADADGKNAKRLLQSWSNLDYHWAPDGKWIVYAQDDNDFNRDIWVMPSDGSAAPRNLSQHPFNERSPVWSPDGKVIAFAGQRAAGSEASVCFVWLRAQDHEKNNRDRTLEKALDKLKGRRKGKPGPVADSSAENKPAGATAPSTPAVEIDFDRLTERVRRVAIGDGSATNLFWSPDSRRLAFTGRIDGRIGTYTIDLEEATPKLLTTQTGTNAHWLRQGNQIVWLAGGVPASMPAPASAAPARMAGAPPFAGTGRRGGAPIPPAAAPSADASASTGAGTAYRFQALQEVDIAKKHVAAFDLAWRTMRDNYYDGRLGNRNWDAIRRKYREAAGMVPDTESFGTVVNLMLGELNGSHLGFFATGSGRLPPGRGAPPAAGDDPASRNWQPVTAHLGMRFDPAYRGPGLKVRDVLPDGPADQKKSRIHPGEMILRIDGVAVDPAMDLTTVLNGPAARDIHVTVKNAEGKERDVTLRPITFAQARNLLYQKWLKDNRQMVEKASNGKLGYLHISGMNMPSFRKFEEELYSVGAGKDGIVIDVRENGGGSTADHLLTALTQPVHAIAVPRGGGPGYPQDRKVYTTWNKPIVVLCNQNSFSNAEIFSHAIKTLKRGQLVGVPTAGGVISTGGTSIMDVGFIRMPFRGWYLINDGQDMELNGAVPHHIIWPEPTHMPQGKDVQLAKAVEVLTADVKAWKDRPQPKLQKAMERPANLIR